MRDGRYEDQAQLGFDLIGLPAYTSAYAVFLIVVGLAFKALTVWYAWTRREQPEPAES